VRDVVSGVDRIGRSVDLLINNAGIGSYGAFHTLAVERELEMVDLNVRALVWLTGHFLPKMVSRGAGGIVQVASTTSFQPVPYMAVYGATKAFVLHFTEAIARETAGTGVRVLAVCPGHTPTEFQAKSGVDKRPTRTTSQDAASVVREALDSFETTEAHVVVTGWPNRIVTQASRIMPRQALSWVLGRGFKPRG
jgi:short-subunit dehydrogenase